MGSARANRRRKAKARRRMRAWDNGLSTPHTVWQAWQARFTHSVLNAPSLGITVVSDGDGKRTGSYEHG